MCCGVFPQTTMESPSIDISRYLASERRISWLTCFWARWRLCLSAISTVWRWGSGILIGAALAWLNFRWLKEGLDALTEAATAQAERPKAKVPVGTYFRAVFRYVLIAWPCMLFLSNLHVPVLSMIFGLCSLGAATMAVSVHEILQPADR